MSEECLKKSLKWGLYKIKKVSPWVEVHAGALPMVNDGDLAWLPACSRSWLAYERLHCCDNMVVVVVEGRMNTNDGKSPSFLLFYAYTGYVKKAQRLHELSYSDPTRPQILQEGNSRTSRIIAK
jgi:hypothetical protein